MRKQADATRSHAPAAGTGAWRRQQPSWVAHLPPCNAACPAGENIQAWLALAQAGKYRQARSEEHTSELQSLMRISYAVFCLKKQPTTYHAWDATTPNKHHIGRHHRHQYVHQR